MYAPAIVGAAIARSTDDLSNLQEDAMQIRYGILSSVVTLIMAGVHTYDRAGSGERGRRTSRKPAQAKAEQPDQPVTVTGCVVREADYRKMQGAGKGGAAGTGVGVGNEFVLTRVSTSPAGAAGGGGEHQRERAAPTRRWRTN